MMEVASYIAGAAGAFCVIVAAVFFGTSYRDAGIWTSCIALCLIVVGGSCWFQGRVWKEDETSNRPRVDQIGFLTPGTGRTPRVEFPKPIPNEMLPSLPSLVREEIASKGLPTPREVRIPPSAVILFFGNTVVWTERFPHAALRQDDEDMIILGKEGSNIWLTAKFFSQDGRIMCDIDKNQFNPNDKNRAYWTAKKTDHRLIVKNDEGNVFLYVEYINEHAIRLLGDFYLRRGVHIIIKEDWQLFGDSKMSGNISGNNEGASFNIRSRNP